MKYALKYFHLSDIPMVWKCAFFNFNYISKIASIRVLNYIQGEVYMFICLIQEAWKYCWKASEKKKKKNQIDFFLPVPDNLNDFNMRYKRVITNVLSSTKTQGYNTLAAHWFSEEIGSNAGHQLLFYMVYVTSCTFVVISNDAPNPDGGQEIKSSYGKDTGKSTLRWLNYQREIKMENSWTLTRGARPGDSTPSKAPEQPENSLWSWPFLGSYWVKWW